MAINRIVVFDSSGLISLLSADDSLHSVAVKVNDRLIRQNWTVLLPREVLAETLNVLGKKGGRAVAVKVGNTILERYEAGDLDLIHAGLPNYKRSLRLQDAAPGGPSFVDCLVMALADEHGTPYIFGFDETFKKCGYQLPESPKIASRAA